MKKLISLVLVVFMTAIIPLSAVAEVEANSFDVNGDGKVNMFDYIFIKGIYFGSIDTVPEFDGADVNGDGKVNIFDCVLVKQAYLSSDDQVTPEEKDISYTAHGLSGYLESCSQILGDDYGDKIDAILVTDFDQLNALLEDFVDYGGPISHKPFDEFAAELSEDYFDTKALVIAPAATGAGSTKYTVEGVKTDENGILMEISAVLYGESYDEPQEYLMTAEVDKSDIIGFTSASGEIVESNIYGIDHYFTADSYIVTDEVLPHRLITNFEQLEELCDGNPELAEYAESLPEGFFDTKVLTLTQIELADGSYVAYTAAVTYGKQGLTVYIEKYSRTVGSYPDLFTVMFAVTELNRADIGDISTFNAKYVD
jgi:hypothetical protein